MDYFATSREHLLAELERLDLLIRAEIAQARRLQADDEQFRGLYISEKEVDALLEQPLGRPTWLGPAASRPTHPQSALAMLTQRVTRAKEESLRRGVELRMPTLQNQLGLDAFELDVLLVCIAAEFDLRYQRLYAYLQDDVTKKKPGIDFVLSLIKPSVSDKLDARRYFSAGAPLLRHQLIELHDDPSSPMPPLLAKFIKIDDRVVEYLLGYDDLDERVRPYVELSQRRESMSELLLDDEANQQLTLLARNKARLSRTVVYFHGPDCIEQQEAAEALASEVDVPFLIVDLPRLVGEESKRLSQTLALIGREAALQGAAIYWQGFDVLFSEQHIATLRTVFDFVAELRGMQILAGAEPWYPRDGLRRTSFVSIHLQRPTLMQRNAIWRRALKDGDSSGLNVDVSALASKFNFTGGQIFDVAATALNLARARGPDESRPTINDIYQACRLHSNQRLKALARKIIPKYRLNDIVLPADRLGQLREICNHMKYRELVYDEWGFEGKLSLGKGLTVLFAGPSGTGKTMAAEVIASELGLDLYKIDLSTVVSKYIGETEKNLARIFTEAETSNAILFFDEADALFGKRSEVKDSHDRYANIEIGYLLQRMEEYGGIAILATNFRKNMDEAFVRRLQFTVEFPFPNEEDRLRIWSNVWPEATPRDPDLVFDDLAKRYAMTGGNIRNIALAAAFYAADDGGVVRMSHLVRATQDEFQKMGKVLVDGDAPTKSHASAVR